MQLGASLHSHVFLNYKQVAEDIFQ